MLVELRPRIETAVSNVSDTTQMVRKQLERLDATVNDMVDRTRLQVIRADDLVSRTLDRVEETTEMVHKAVVSPVRQVSGVLRGLTAGLEYLVGSRRRNRDVGVPQDEMFI
jgi:archaellum component FlaC